MAGLCPFCAAATNARPGATTACPRCGGHAAAIAAALPETATRSSTTASGSVIASTAPASTATLTLDEPTTELPAGESFRVEAHAAASGGAVLDQESDGQPEVEGSLRRHRIVWPRVIALAAITLVASFAAWAALSDVASRTAPAADAELAIEMPPPRLASTVTEGPRLGDLRSVTAYIPEPEPVATAKPAPARRPAAPRPPEQPSGGFTVVTGPREPWFEWSPSRGFRPTPNCPRQFCG